MNSWTTTRETSRCRFPQGLSLPRLGVCDIWHGKCVTSPPTITFTWRPAFTPCPTPLPLPQASAAELIGIFCTWWLTCSSIHRGGTLSGPQQGKYCKFCLFSGIRLLAFSVSFLLSLATPPRHALTQQLEGPGFSLRKAKGSSLCRRLAFPCCHRHCSDLLGEAWTSLGGLERAQENQMPRNI